MPSKKGDSSWMKNHPLEGDNIVTGFYLFLAKKNPKTMKPCRDILVPDTIVFEHNFPRGWFTTDVKAREVMRKQGRDLDAATIEKGFTENVSDVYPTVATYLCMQEEDLGNGETETKTLVEVFNKDTIGEFLARKTKHEGILQKFIQPKGYQNSVIKVVWSPRVCIVQRRTNKYVIHDKKRATGDPFSNVVTYEGPTFLSSEGAVSSNVGEEIKRLCGCIVQHFYYTEHKFITRMVLYFKIDKKNRLWFLWCGSLRVSDRNGVSEMPVNLNTNFAEPETGDSYDEDRILWEADEAFLRITNDEMFFETFMRKVKLVNNASGADDSDATGAASAKDKRHANDAESNELRGDDYEDRAGLSGSYDWGATPEPVQTTHERLVGEHEEMDTIFEDLFYKTRSYYCTNPKGQPYELELPQRVFDVLGASGVEDLMKTLHLWSGRKVGQSSTTAEGSAEETTSEVPRRYVVEVTAPKTPVTKLSDEAKEWLTQFFKAKDEQLRLVAKDAGDEAELLEALVAEL